METSNFYEDSSEDEFNQKDFWDDYGDVYFSRQPLSRSESKKSTLTGSDTRQSLKSFRFLDQSPASPLSPSWPLDCSMETPVSPLEPKLPRVKPVRASKVNRERLGTTVPVKAGPQSERRYIVPRQTEEGLLGGISSTGEDGLQEYVQTLLQGSMAEGNQQGMNLYQECLSRKNCRSSQFLSPKSKLVSRTPNNLNNNRISVMSTASDASAVPSLIFSDPGVQTRRPSTVLSAPTQPASSRPLRRNSASSLGSINTVASNKSWFMDDESPPQSPVMPVVPTPVIKVHMSFSRGVGLGMSLFDDGSDDESESEDNERVQVQPPQSPQSLQSLQPSQSLQPPQSPQSPQSPFLFFMGSQTTPKASTASSAAKKSCSSHNIHTTEAKAQSASHSSTLSPVSHSPVTAAHSPVCSTPARRKSRRRTASSECIVLEALEKMNAVMCEFANGDINRKSVVGIDLPGNQVSVEAYGELWW